MQAYASPPPKPKSRCAALLECLEVAVGKFAGPQLWAVRAASPPPLLRPLACPEPKRIRPLFTTRQGEGRARTAPHYL